MKKLKKFKPKRTTRLLAKPPVLIACTLIAVAGTVLLINSRAASYCDINPASTVASVESSIAGCADGSTIRFPQNASYTLPSRILVSDRSNLVIDGNGSTFKTTAPNDGRKLEPNWLILRGTNIHIKNMKIIGNFNIGPPRSAARIGEAAVEQASGNAFNMGVGIYGGVGNYVTDMDIKQVYGDGVAVAVGWYINGPATDPMNTPRDTHIERVKVTTTARHCISPSQANGFWLIDSELNDCWYGAMDAELDAVDQKLQDIHILRNVFNGFALFGLTIPVAGDNGNTSNIEIRNNTFLTGADVYCNNVMDLGIYPTNPNKIKNIIVENNTFHNRSGIAVHMIHVDGGSVQNNKDVDYNERNCSYPNGATPFFGSQHTSNVTVANNGPNAAGASTATPAPPPTTEPTPTPPPPTTTPPPASSTLTAPGNLTGNRVSDSRIDLNWTASSGPVLYYYIWRNNTYLGAVHVNQGVTTYSDTAVDGTSSYTYFVRAEDTAGNTKDSNTVTVGAATTPPPAPAPPPNPCDGKPASDINCDGAVNAVDISAFRQRYKTTDPAADFNKDGTVNAVDISAFRHKYKSGS